MLRHIGNHERLYGHINSERLARPKFIRPQPVSFAVCEAVGKELERLEKLEILEHSQWAAPIVPVPKSNGQFKIYGDYKSTVSDALEADRYPLPKPSDLFTALTDGESLLYLSCHKHISK